MADNNEKDKLSPEDEYDLKCFEIDKLEEDISLVKRFLNYINFNNRTKK